MPRQKLIVTLFRYLLLMCVLALAACSASANSQQGVAPTRTSTPFLGNLTPKGPGSAGLTATARATPIPVHCQVPPLTSANTQGWQTYTDPHYPFHFSFPIGWQVGATSDSSADSSFTYYEVFVLPPTGHTPINEYSTITEPESIRLAIVLTQPAIHPDDRFSSGSTWTPETTPILLSHVPTKLSYRFSPECGEFNRGTDPVTFGQHPYSFYLEARDQADKGKGSQIFRSIVESFSYTGSK
ncbi:MAG: hypothetical protein ABI234_14930 [Ktedonobacteraceae bacterium]